MWILEQIFAVVEGGHNTCFCDWLICKRDNRYSSLMTSLPTNMIQLLNDMREKWGTLVVHCKKKHYDVYIGRASAGAPKGVSCKWGNPFPMRNQSDEERIRVSCQYREWLYRNPDLMAQARIELKGKVLGCWCDPKYCHGHILADLVNTPDYESTADQKLPAESGMNDPDTSMTGITYRNTDNEFSSKETPKTIFKTPTSQIDKFMSNCERSGTVATSRRTPTAQIHQCNTATSTTSSTPPMLIDIGVNYTNPECKKDWQGMLSRAAAAGVSSVLLTGTCLSSSSEVKQVVHDTSTSSPVRLSYTVGIHPHRAKSFHSGSIDAMRNLLISDPRAVAVGECGLDFHRNLSAPAQQKVAFREQVRLACELEMPLFVHEREAHRELLEVLDEFGSCSLLSAADGSSAQLKDGGGRELNRPVLPPIVIHCFTGSREEAMVYLERGFYIGLTGTLCKKERGASLRELVASPDFPLERLMLETDAPYMGFVKSRRSSEPADVALIAETVAKLKSMDVCDVRRIVTETTVDFFRLNRKE